MRRTLLIDFAGFGGMGEDISLEEAYDCEVRGRAISLYFRRVNRSCALRLAESTEFVASLDKVASDDSVQRRGYLTEGFATLSGTGRCHSDVTCGWQLARIGSVLSCGSRWPNQRRT